MASIQDIETIVIVMLENRSFDNVLGHLSHPAFGGRNDVDGLVDPATTPDYDNFHESQVYKPFPATDKAFVHDLPHTRRTIGQQLDIINGQATMGGFVKSYALKTNTLVKNPPPMGFLRPKAVPISGFLAKEYVVCDRWFSPLPSGTQANRCVAFTGGSLIDNNVKKVIPHRNLVFDWLEQKGVRWRVYHSGLSFFLLFGRFEDAVGPNFRSIRRLAQDFQREPGPSAPQVVFIEPEYEDSPVHFGFAPNDNHPPLPMGPGEAFLHGIYQALTKNPARWQKTLLVVTYDEHGGFYDHVEPPAIRLTPGPGSEFQIPDPFETAGVRVPSLVASPLVAQQGVCSATLDHTSVLQLLAERFGAGTDDYSDDVTSRRDQGIESLSVVLSGDPPRTDVPKAPAASLIMRSVMRPGVKKSASDNQEAFLEAAQDAMVAEPDAAIEKFPELALLEAPAPGGVS